MYRVRGLSDAATDVQIGSSLAIPVATPLIGGALSTTGTLAAGSTILGMAPALAVPIIGAALAGVAIAAEFLIRNSGCGITCVETSEWANKAEPILKQNLQAYQALPSPRTQSQQTAALAIFDNIWGQLSQLCSQPGTGNAGVRCISDRQAGACKWKDSSGQCWNWFSGYRDPIANDKVVPDDQATPGALLNSGSLFSLPPWLVFGAAALAIWMVVK